MQRGFIDPSSPICIAGAAGTVPACAEAIRFFHESELPVFYAVRHYRADGSDVEKARAKVWADGGKPLSETCDESMSDAFPEEFEVLDCDRIMIKPRFSAFSQRALTLSCAGSACRRSYWPVRQRQTASARPATTLCRSTMTLSCSATAHRP